MINQCALTRKMVGSAIFILFYLGFMIATAFGQNHPDSTDAQRRIVQRIHERFGIWAAVDTNGIILGLSGDRMNANLSVVTPIERGFQFLELYADLFQINNPRQEFKATNFHSGPDYTYDYSGGVYFQQMVNGVKVINAGYHMRYIPDTTSFKFFSISGRLIPEARMINTTPLISQAYAESLALSDPEHDSLIAYVTIGGKTELIIDNIDGSLRLIWKLNVQNGRFAGSANYWIDANTGAVLKVESGLIY
jgi:hypothetical protein